MLVLLSADSEIMFYHNHSTVTLHFGNVIKTDSIFIHAKVTVIALVSVATRILNGELLQTGLNINVFLLSPKHRYLVGQKIQFYFTPYKSEDDQGHLLQLLIQVQFAHNL